MTVVFESIESGTRITITNSGFGERATDLSGVMRGQAETIADLILYLETGVAFPRHHHGETELDRVRRAGDSGGVGGDLSSSPIHSPHGLGLQAGDMLVELGGASVFSFAEVQFFTKEHAAGEEATAAWIRDGAADARFR